MAYTRHTWAAGPSGNTPITYTKLNEMETGIYNAHNGYTSAQATATSANNRSLTNASNITSLTTRVTTAEGSISTLSSDVQYLNADVTDINTSLGNMGTTLTAHDNSIAANASDITSLDSRVTTLESSGGGSGGGSSSSAELTVTQFTNTADVTIANNAWNISPALSNWPGYTQPGDIALVNTAATPGTASVVKGGLYLFSLTAVDTQNPSGQANFFCELDQASDPNGTSVTGVLARFQFYATNQGAGSAIVNLPTGSYLRFAFRQNATGGSMVLPNGVNGVNTGGYVGLAIRFVKIA